VERTDVTTPVDCTAIVVSYNSSDDIGGLLDCIPAAAAGLRVRTIVVDNDSADAAVTEKIVAGYPDAVFVPAGGNLGYAGGVNVGRRYCGGTSAVLILNPDVRLAPGSIRLLFDQLRDPSVGAAVPLMRDEAGHVSPSLRREPTLPRALGDALLGARWPGRPAGLSEMVWDDAAYHQVGAVEWATGAVLLISAAADAAVGPWDDERFFLYSEETDYCRRLREAGWSIRYVPDAQVMHEGGGSETGAHLVALLTVNRIRYYRKYHGRLASAGFRGVVALNEALRASRPASRVALKAVLSQRSWDALPGGRRRNR
jgi:N-acetylglucosaminyl-diphospho-decaprenol L-rhamnosyltransferase